MRCGTLMIPVRMELVIMIVTISICLHRKCVSCVKDDWK